VITLLLKNFNPDNDHEYIFQISRCFASFCAQEPAPSPIPFASKVKKMDKVDGPDAEKSEWIKLKFLMGPDNPASKYSWKFAIFMDGCPEDWIKWVMAFREIENLMSMKEPADKTRMFRTLLKD
jgi:hypothetical protein